MSICAATALLKVLEPRHTRLLRHARRRFFAVVAVFRHADDSRYYAEITGIVL